MVVIVRPDVPQEKIDHLTRWLQGKDLIVREFRGQRQVVLGLIGDTRPVDIDMLRSLDIVESVAEMTDTFKASSRQIHPDDTVINFQLGPSIGGGSFALFAGPCSVESREQITAVAKEVKAGGAHFLRGGAFKPRTSPYDFQGLGEEGLDLLVEAREATGLPIVTELMDLRSLH
ncbi:MAG: 3-deoxy-7-phosphoheptulonate synthase, partial [Treponema sp.]|nr:3-deoxy-7-phosphoheptulonate synthase [Treponema sp.]